MAETCYYKLFGEEFGPVSLDELREMIRTSQLAGEDEVRLDNDRPWQKVDMIPDLRSSLERAGTTTDRFTPQRTRGLFSSVNESAAARGSDGDASAANADSFMKLDELTIVAESATSPGQSAASADKDHGRRVSPVLRSTPAKGPARQGSPLSRVQPGSLKPVGDGPARRQGSNSGTAVATERTPPAPAAAPETRWFCWTNNKQYGPISLQTLVEWAAQGRLTADDHVKLGEAGEWLQVRTIPELSQAPSVTTASGPSESNTAVRGGVTAASIAVAPLPDGANPVAATPAPSTVASSSAMSSPLAGSSSGVSSVRSSLMATVSKPTTRERPRRSRDDDGEGFDFQKNLKSIILLGVLTLVGACVYLPSSAIFGSGFGHDKEMCQALHSHHEKLKELRSKVDTNGWVDYAKKVQPEIDGYKKTLEKTASAKYQGRQQLLFAVKAWPQMIGDSMVKAGQGEDQFVRSLSSATKLLNN